jgi:hydrogenase maturation protein HypF
MDSERQVGQRITITGVVQGVGFRPFIYRLATEIGLMGWVNNSSQGVRIEVEGAEEEISAFISRIQTEKPPLAIIQRLETASIPHNGASDFVIQHTDSTGEKTTLILPDVATCPECLRECLDPNDRRFLYPFTNCTNCGPRFSIIESLPYDRPNTTMKQFEMCDDCRAEYENPLDRRFHAQPNACPVCGPHLELWDADGTVLATHQDALRVAAKAIRWGEVVALKGLGGFQLLVDARNNDAIKRLRARKQRDEKPFALMMPSLGMAQQFCHVSDLEANLLQSHQSPIVLLKRTGGEIAPSIAPGNPYLGVMLPYTPLHHLLMAELGFPVVATSGNLSGEPICIDEHDALERLGAIADHFLVHNRPIVRQVDDSIVRVMGGRAMMVRRARGYAPLPLPLDAAMPVTLAVGAHLKNTIAVAVGKNLFTSQHIGDLETAGALDAFRQTIKTFESLYETAPEIIAHDAHPDYASTQFAVRARHTVPLQTVAVQHHVAHVLACMADNHLDGPVLGVSWDGTGYGLDGTVWGGEFLHIPARNTPNVVGTQRDASDFERVAHLRQFRLPGGDKAVKEPRRSALGLLYEIFGDEAFNMTHLAPVAAFTKAELRVLQTMLQKGLNTPKTSSAGRLFDAVASLVGLRQVINFEGQAAMMLEWETPSPNPLPQYGEGEQPTQLASMARSVPSDGAYDFTFVGVPMVMDWQPMILGILDDLNDKVPIGEISARFHNTLSEMTVAVAKQVGEKRVVLTGGCFQNQVLTERAIQRLREEGFEPFWHKDIPPNDGGIAPGQIMACCRL